jgi:hypothetical protein
VSAPVDGAAAAAGTANRNAAEAISAAARLI